MKYCVKYIFCFLLINTSVIFYSHAQSTTRKFGLQVDWPTYMAQHDLLWNRMPKDYFDGAFVGNGLLGAILFADDQLPNTLRFEIGSTDVYDHRTPSPSAYETSRLPIGQLLLTPVGKILKTSIRNDLWNAEIRGQITTTEGSLSFRCFVPSDEELIIVTLKTTGKESAALRICAPAKKGSVAK